MVGKMDGVNYESEDTLSQQGQIIWHSYRTCWCEVSYSAYLVVLCEALSCYHPWMLFVDDGHIIAVLLVSFRIATSWLSPICEGCRTFLRTLNDTTMEYIST